MFCCIYINMYSKENEREVSVIGLTLPPQKKLNKYVFVFFIVKKKLRVIGTWVKMPLSRKFLPFDIKLVVKVFFSQITTNTSSLFSESLRHESCVLYPEPRDPYACEVCDKPFKTIASLKQHTKVRDHVNWNKLSTDSPVRKMQISCLR